MPFASEEIMHMFPVQKFLVMHEDGAAVKTFYNCHITIEPNNIIEAQLRFSTLSSAEIVVKSQFSGEDFLVH